MKLVKACDEYEMGQICADLIENQIRLNPKSVLGLATGKTPTHTYKELIKRYEMGKLSFENVSTFNLDEYCNLLKQDPESYHHYMQVHLFDAIDIKIENTRLPNPELDPDQACLDYKRALKAKKIDLQILGLGSNGHIGFNEPGCDFGESVYLTKLTEQTRNDNSVYFDGIENVPKHAITMGIQSILDADQIVLLVNSIQKKEALNRLLKGEVDKQWPVTALCAHKDVTVIVLDAIIA